MEEQLKCFIRKEFGVAYVEYANKTEEELVAILMKNEGNSVKVASAVYSKMYAIRSGKSPELVLAS